VTDEGKPVVGVALHLGMSVHNFYAWIKLWSNLIAQSDYPVQLSEDNRAF
jgi:transposase-like protein